MKKRASRLLKGVCFCFLVLAIALPAYAADKLIVESSGSHKVVAQDDGKIRLNSNTFDASAWTLLYGAKDGNLSGFAFDSNSNNAGHGGGGMFRFARGTQASKLAVQSGDRLGFFAFYGYDGSAFQGSAALTAKTDGAVSAGSVPTKLVFETGTAYPRPERMVISSSGTITINNLVGPHVGGSAYVCVDDNGVLYTSESGCP